MVQLCAGYERHLICWFLSLGYADAIAHGLFLLPHEEKMLFSDFLKELDNPSATSVSYIQKQNSNMTSELAELLDDVDEHLPWATEAFGTCVYDI